MGYSCTAKASMVLDAIRIIADQEWPEITSKGSNWLPNGFWEIGREQRDGSITGTVWQTVRIYTPEERQAAAIRMNISNPEWVGNPVRRAGSFRIDSDGNIVRFPMVPTKLRREAEKIGLAKYRETFERG